MIEMDTKTADSSSQKKHLLTPECKVSHVRPSVCFFNVRPPVLSMCRAVEKLILVASFFARDFDHKVISESRRLEMGPFYDPKRTLTKLFFQVIYTAPFLTRVAPIES